MTVVGLITEYNPFHNGHKYHLEEAKRVTGADYVIVVMSGNFVQRGAPAMMDKYSRARMALNNGADLVFEIPVCYATGSAEYFAHGAVALLDKLGIVDYLCFGSESGDITLLKESSHLLISSQLAIESSVKEFMKEGDSYPVARAKALKQSMLHSGRNHEDLADFLSKPNNILGIEYIKALSNLFSSIKPATITRQAANYHDPSLSLETFTKLSSCDSNLKAFYEVEEVAISSATAIRNSIKDKQEFTNGDHIKRSIPPDVYEFIRNNYQKTFPIIEEDFSSVIKYKLSSENAEQLKAYVDISGDLADRLANLQDFNMSILELCQHIKTKNVTLTRINRALCHSLLNIKKETFEQYKDNGYIFYARVLGIKKASSHLLRQITKMEKIPIITKVSKADEQLDPLGKQMLSEDLFATHVYNQAVYEKYKYIIPNEYKYGIVIL